MAVSELHSWTSGIDVIEQSSVLAERIAPMGPVVARALSIHSFLAGEPHAPSDSWGSVFFNPIAIQIAACCVCLNAAVSIF